ncbi:MAG: hypothetical protein GY820_26980 [Gammaproteobacteria bacterium]|nr:hypothetical protein [Gammaproteobacteria bacterium]
MQECKVTAQQQLRQVGKAPGQGHTEADQLVAPPQGFRAQSGASSSVPAPKERRRACRVRLKRGGYSDPLRQWCRRLGQLQCTSHVVERVVTSVFQLLLGAYGEQRGKTSAQAKAEADQLAAAAQGALAQRGAAPSVPAPQGAQGGVQIGPPTPSPPRAPRTRRKPMARTRNPSTMRSRKP